ncbi:MAG: peptide-methionine (S)-S-oxide reductase MsrA [Dehalococcoidia bacterium]|nr:peptide-methionine (S)-S-oxide reductase MsrA [Dehalococcoidia bacterium]
MTNPATDGAGADRPQDLEAATLAGGCFWCLEAVYELLRGVRSVTSGYAGGHVENPSYEAVCAGVTGHAEVVQVEFDPQEISFRDLIDVFFTIHDPTTLNRQGHDVGTQYRSAIYTHSQEQQEAAREVIRDLTTKGLWSDPIVTEVEPLVAFYPAEDYHAEYYRRNPGNPYCGIVIAPKVAKARSKFFERLKDPSRV